MAVVTGALGSLVPKLGQLLQEEYMPQKSARKKLDSLIKELEYAHTALCKVAAVPPDQLDEHVKIWAREIRDASYDMEDIIDAFLVRVDGSCHHPSFFRSIQDHISKLFERRKIAVAMDGINKRLEEVTERYGRYTVIDNITMCRPQSLDPRLAAMYKEVTELVGIDKPSNELEAMLSTIKMVSVVGAGGLGKTTLAKSVYDKLKVNFECSAFVPVGRNPEIKGVFRDILRQIDKKEYDEHIQFYNQATVRQLIDDLREAFLENKSYLLVIDDVWETESWETIKLALVQKNNQSRVIITTRIWKVAEEAGEVYKLEHLPYDKSKKLFYTRIFGSDGKCPDNELDEVSDKILRKCDGVPLAIITMASLLVGKSREKWVEVCRSITFRDKDNKQVNDTEWILSLSYYDLAPHLRTCLLYLSIFPEDQVIDKDNLIWKWVAEGFIHKDRLGTRLFEVGNGYFNEFINRSMIQAVESDEGFVVGCRVHDMVLDLLRLKSQEDNFVSTLISKNAEATSSSSSKVRRISHQNNNTMMEYTQMDLGCVRSFIAFSNCSIIDEGFSFRSFKLLRVVLDYSLDRYKSSTPTCLKHLKNLLHLRYLRLKSMVIQEIPEEIGALNFLETLDLEGSVVKNIQLPSSVGLLTQLMCLHAGYTMAPNGVIEKLTSLEQLEIRVQKDTVEHFVKELGKLHELRVLKAQLDCLGHNLERDLVESLGNLHKIQHLKLNYDKLESIQQPLETLILRHLYFSELPLCISPTSIPNLTTLQLCVEYMGDQHLKILGQLPELSHLNLQIGRSNNACSSTITDGCFRKLRSLWLNYSAVQFVHNKDSTVLFLLNKRSSLPLAVGNSREKCVVAPAVMPNLQVLRFIVNLKDGVHNGICDNLGLDCLPSLQRVRVALWCFGCPAYDVERAQVALRRAIEGHPNRPTLQMGIWVRLENDLKSYARQTERTGKLILRSLDVCKRV